MKPHRARSLRTAQVDDAVTTTIPSTRNPVEAGPLQATPHAGSFSPQSRDRVSDRNAVHPAKSRSLGASPMTVSSLLRGGNRTYFAFCIVCTLIFALVGLGVSLLITPTYQADARMLVSVTSAAPAGTSGSYQENTVAQQLALSLVPFASSEVVTERVVESLRLPTTASELSKRVTARVEPETVLINISVSDPSPTSSREITNALAFEYSDFVSRLQPESGLKPSVSLVQPAVTPTDPVAPNVGRNVALSGLAGLAVGAVAAAFVTRRHRTISDVDTIESVVGQPLLGSLPYSRAAASSRLYDDREREPAVIEASRDIRTNLLHSLARRSSRVVAITSAEVAEGKTWAASEIAYALTDAGHSVVIVDGDLRTGGLSKRHNAPDNEGLAEVLRGTSRLANCIVNPDGVPYFVLPAGRQLSYASELLGSSNTRPILDDLQREFTYVIIDTPPLLAFTDAAVIASSCGAVINLTRYSTTELDSVEAATASLNLVDAPIIGSVFTFAPIANARLRKLHTMRRTE